MTAPVILYFALSESSRAQATLGRRAPGLRVVMKSGTRVPVSAWILRSCIMFLPWECGHIVANQAAFSATDLPGWIYLPLALAAILPTWWLASVLIRVDAPYDVVASTQVIHCMPA